MGKFTTKGHDTTDNFAPFEAGKYTMVLVKAEKKESQTAGNFYNNCQFKVIKGKNKGRVVFCMYNVKNSNEQAEEIGQKQLRQLMNAIGVDTIKDMWDLTPLMNKSFKCRIKITKDATHGDKNEIAGYIDKEAGSKDSESSSDTSDPFGDEKKGKKDKKKGKKDKKKGKKDDVPF